MRNDMRRDRTKKLLRDAMTKLLEEKSFDQITTSELVKRAGISRSGFYTHYSDKYDMIEFYQQIFFNTIQYVFEKNKGNLRETLLETYEFLNNNEIYVALLSENGSKEIHNFILQKLTNLIEETVYPFLETRKAAGKVGDTYAKIYFANAVFGLTQAWIRRNRKETPAEMANLFVALVGTEVVR
ncbi:MAG: TetR/AcrR family transcriptional regulator [Streptococcaceae bacterium]|jgi:AcrR family transcriptional regulator|nr:TetR/AcrR family transcriptional regulator [Streptococcaceae bacterium]